mmetsp:Transcript_81455/g.236167  ORF Transcript_81455/g.236167 Transcript_81455/m.236167 type:complete len:257 (-) Transcript_81455:118-888(-)
MASLTPKHRSGEVTDAAMNEGIINGVMVGLPSLAGLYVAMQNPKFRKLTNWQSRTALVIMPALFAFALTSEQKLMHRMHEVAEETEHAIQSVEWADRHQRSQKELQDETAKQKQLRELYRQSVLNSGVRVVDELNAYHQMANYVQENPFKVIAGIGVPAVVAIFYGKSGKEHLSLQLKILHTRVFGQFTVVCTLLGVMGLKDMMDKQGKFITQAQVEQRVLEMEKTRSSLLERLEYQANNAPEYMKAHKRKQPASS